MNNLNLELTPNEVILLGLFWGVGVKEVAALNSFKEAMIARATMKDEVMHEAFSSLSMKIWKATQDNLQQHTQQNQEVKDALSNL